MGRRTKVGQDQPLCHELGSISLWERSAPRFSSQGLGRFVVGSRGLPRDGFGFD